MCRWKVEQLKVGWCSEAEYCLAITQMFTSNFVFQDHSANAWATAATFAHELGHNFGLQHDEDCKYSKSKPDCPAMFEVKYHS